MDSSGQDDNTLRIAVLSNMSQCYINLELYEDALEFANMALKVDDSHVKTLYRKAKSLSLLYKFDESSAIFE